MKQLKTALLAAAFVLSLTFISNSMSSAGTLTAFGQETMMKQVGSKIEGGAKKTISATKSGVNKGRRVGTTVGNRTWNGSKWVASKSYTGGKWVAVKSVNGTKWVYRKGKNVFSRTKRAM